MTLEELEVVINANAKQFNAQVAQVQNKVDNMSNRVNHSVEKMSGTFEKLGKVIGNALAIGAIAKFTKSCLDLGSDLAEVQNVVDVTFGSMNTKVNEFAKNAWKTVGLSETMAKKYMGNFGAMSKSMGFTVTKAEEMAETLTNLSGDVASFYNITQDEAYTKLKSVFTGETETLKELGVVMTQENLNQYALANGYGKTTEKMNQQEKVALRLAYVTQTLSAANGDFARTSNSWANQVRLLSLQFQSLKSSIGQGLIAVLTPVINVINTIMSKLVQMANTFNSILSAIGFTIGGGESGGGTAILEGDTSGIGGATDAMKGLGGATDGVGKSADKTKKKLEALMGIDEINKINLNNDNAGGGSGGGGASGSGGIASPAIDTSKTEDSLSAFNDRINKILSEVLSPLRKAWDNYGDWFLSKWDYFKKAFGYSCDALKNFLISVWNHGGKEFVQHMAEIGIVIGGVALQIGGDILVALGNLWNHLNPDNNPYTRKFIVVMNELAIAVRDFIISAGNWFGKFLDLGGQAFINVIGDIIVLVGTILAEIMRDAVKFITDFMNSWAGSVIIGTVAMTLNIVAGAIKAVLVVIEKCHKVLEVLLALWAVWKVQYLATTASSLLTTESAIGILAGRLSGLATSILTQITLCKSWYKELALNCVNGIKKFGIALSSPIKTLKSFGTSIYLGTLYLKDWIVATGTKALKAIKSFGETMKISLLYLKDWVVATGTKAIQSIGKFIISIGTSIASLVGLTVAEGTATVGATALNIALGALGIGVIIAAVTGLIVAVKKIGDKFGWWASLSNLLGQAMDWLKEKLGWLWDKIADFFGWDTEPAVEENIQEVGEVAEETAKTTDDAFGTATSNVNRYLDSINFNATKLAEQVNEATNTASEKFGMLSKNANEYLDAIVNNDTDRLAQMGSNQSVYNEEVKAMYADLTEAEKNEFMKRYGIIQGINDDMLNYEGLSYDERVARHAAYLSTIENDESLSYQEKKAKLDQANIDFQASIDSEVNKYKESIASKQQALTELLTTHGNTTEEGKLYEQSLRDEIEADRRHIEEITQSSYDGQVATAEEATGAMAQANKDGATAQEDVYKNLATTAEDSMNIVNESINGARENIESFTNGSNNLALNLRMAFNGVGAQIAGEFNMASASIANAVNKIQNVVGNSASSLRNIIGITFSNIQQIISNALNNVLSTCQTVFNNVLNSTLQLALLMTTGFELISDAAEAGFSNVKTAITTEMNSAYNNVDFALKNIKTLFDNFSATLKVKIPHFYMYGNFNAETGEVPKVGVNYFAKGGIVDRATLGIIGEAGKEAIMPLENNTEWISDLAEKVANRMPQGTQESGFGNGDLTLIIDGSVVGKVALKELRKMQRQGGITLIPT